MIEAIQTPNDGSQAPPGRGHPMVLPRACGRYSWGDEHVIVWLEDGELWGAAQYVGIEKVADIDREFREDLAFYGLAIPEKPWTRVGDCYRDDCECHGLNASDHPRNGA